MRRRAFLIGAGSAGLRLALPGWGAEATLGIIAFIQRDGLWIRDLPNGKPERLAGATALASPRFSPSGQWIAYFEGDVLHVIPRHGGKGIRVGGAGRGAQWLPNRDELLVDSPAGLNVFSPSNGWSEASRRIAYARLPVVFSPQGDQIVYGRTGRLCRLALNQTESEPKVLVSKDASGQLPCVWSGNGRQILFWEDPDFSASAMAEGLELFRVPADGGSPRSMGISTLVHNDMLSLSPDGTRLAITVGSGRYEWEQKRIAVIDLNTSAISHLTDNRTAAVCPSWCPRGDRIAFAAAAAPGTGAAVGGGEPARRLLEKRRIYMSGVSGTSTPRQLTNDGLYRDEEPMWSADGSHILFARIDRGNNQTLWLMEAESPSPIQVAGPLYAGTGLAGLDETWFGYYGYIDWRTMVDWYRGAPAAPASAAAAPSPPPRSR
jgi:Tol biopolymer transport system component